MYQLYNLPLTLKCLLFVLSPVPDYVKATVETVLKIHETEDDGDVLAFLTGQVSGPFFTITQPLFDRRV